MKKIYLIICIIMTLLLNGCTTVHNNEYSDHTFLLGTIIKITIYDKREDSADLIKEMFKKIEDIENKVSKNIKTSEVSNINKNAGKKGAAVSDETFQIIKTSLDYSRQSKGKFDITIGSIVDLWKIGTDEAVVPKKETIQKTIPLVDYTQIDLDEKKQEVMLKQENMCIDLGGIAKGYVADELVKYMNEKNVKSGIINLGGNIVTVGKKTNGDSFKVGIRNPLSNTQEALGYIKSSDLSVVTSGTYERYFEYKGVRYHHILDTKTGYPVDNNLLSVSIVSKKSIKGDALSTTVFALGLEKGLELIEKQDDVEAVFVTKDKKVYLSKGIDKLFTLMNKSFKIKQ